MPRDSGKIQPTIDEIVSTLRKSSVPSVVIEGSDDVIVYRGLENRYRDFFLDILPMGGRDRVLQLLRRKEELTGCPVCFIVDQDCWVYSGIPDDLAHERLFFTDGYSVENDVYRDFDWESLLSERERLKFKSELSIFIKWYALALSRRLAGRDAKIDHHPDHYFRMLTEFKHEMLLCEGECYPSDLELSIADDYARLLRGKSLVGLIMRQLSYKGRDVHHQHKSLLEIGGNKPGPLLEELFGNIGSALFGPAITGVSQ